MNGYAPWQTLEPLVSEQDVLAATDEALAATISVLIAEQTRRALAANDPAAVAEDAFENSGFDYRGTPSLPYLHNGLLVCPGVKVEKSRTSHDCVFVSIGDAWAWEHPEVVFDEMRQLPGAKVVRRAVTIVPAYEGMVYDVVTSAARSGSGCQMRSARSFVVRAGQLVETKARTRPATGHR